MRVMSAEKGVDYLLRTVVSGDGDRSLGTPLTRYYTEAGTPPGTWLGSGLAQLGHGEINAGDEVSEPQLRLLIGAGRDPVTGDQLGVAFQRFRTVDERIADRVAALDPGLGPASRVEAVEAIIVEERRRGHRSAVAGYDYTFSLPKSASVLWGVADAGLQSLIVDAHHRAVAEVLDFMEREVAATRVGATLHDGAVAQVDTFGFAATAYDHYDSRANDPHLHTHVVVSNKVKTVLDGKWRSLDGRPMHAATVALSELHEAVVADHFTRLLGVEWEARDRGRNRNRAWAIKTVPEVLMTEFSSRAQHIDEETDRLIDSYLEAHGRRPSPATIMKLRAQATLTTRPPKKVRSLADLTGEWRQRAASVLGRDVGEWVRSITPDARQRLLRADDIPLDLIRGIGAAVMETVGEKRTTWHRWNLVAEASRQLMGYRFASMQDREAVTGLVVDAAEQASLRLTPPELASVPVLFQRSDGSSAFRPKHSTLFSSEALLEAESRLLDRTHVTSGPTVPLEIVERIATRPDRQGRMLAPDQVQALAAIAAAGRQVDVLVGPAGAGKTSAMFALRRAWEAEHGRGSVLGLAPSAVAAQVLADDLGIATENTAKWWTDHLSTGATFRPGQLVIVDEASLAGTLALDRITQVAADVGAKVLLVGDYSQLQAVEASGAFGLLVRDRDDAPQLVDVHRFTNAWERTASLQLRLGDTDVIDAYLEHERVTSGTTEAMITAAYDGWRADTMAGRASILVTGSTESVAALNLRAQTDLILAGTVTPEEGEVRLREGASAAAGDTVITRRNDRRLGTGRRWVRNGDRWQITKIQADGSAILRPLDHRVGRVVLPAAYVAEHLDLGYAITAYRAQGITVDTSHVLVDTSMTRENLYVSMTRGRDQNHAYVATDRPDEAHDHPPETADPTAAARAVLFGVIQHSGAELSAHETITAEQERWGSIAQLAAEYETIATEAQRDRWITLIQTSGLTEEQIQQVIDSDVLGALMAEFRRAEANNYDVESLLPRLIRARSIEDSADIASVLHHRLERAAAQPADTGRQPAPARLIAGLIPAAVGVTDPGMRRALTDRHHLIVKRAAALADDAIANGTSWIEELGECPANATQRRAWMRYVRVVAAYRDRYGVTAAEALGPTTDNTARRIDQARARQAIRRARDLADTTTSLQQQGVEPAGMPAGRSL
ncbi:MobF family relaxase [Microbacterium sp. 2MCAF23]|uniref:MobF family relaxase n=1 Tax=Microbacterium sp. 2MCAF23 TaxID=3232985 RepID=UPI003F973CB7